MNRHILAFKTSVELFSSILHDTSKAAYYRCGISLLVLTLLSILAQWAVSPVHLVASPQDVIGFIDAGYRVTSGQVPHNDFSTQLGPAFSYLYAIGVALFGPNISAVVSSNLLMMAFTTLLAWLLSYQRLNPLLALIFSATVMTTTSGVVPLGWDIHGTDYAMSYNRHALGILMCVCVGSFFQKRGSISGVVDSSENILIGALVSLLLLLKLNFFVIGVCTLVISPFFVDLDFKKFAWTFLGFLLPISFFWLVLGVKPQAFLNDMSLIYSIVRETRPPMLGSVWKLVTQLVIPISTVFFTIVATGWLCFVSQKGVSHSLARSFVAAVFLLAADLVLGVSNTQLPILVFLPFISLIALRELQMVDYYRSQCLPALIIFTFLLILCILTIVRETSYVAYAFGSKLSANPSDVEAQRIDSPLLDNVYVPSGLTVMSNYPLFWNDGLKLLKRHISPGDRLVTLHYSNPFNFALGLKPTKGTSVYWHYGSSHTNTYHLQAEQVFSNAELIIIQHVMINEFWPIYGDYIQKYFALVDQTRIWVLLKRVRH